MSAKDLGNLDDEVNLLAPPTQNEKNTIVESNFLSTAGGDAAASLVKSGATSQDVSRVLQSTPVKKLAMEKVTNLSPRQTTAASMLSPN